MLLQVKKSQNSVNTSGTQGSALSAVKLCKKYSWYPNATIISPRCLKESFSPSPKVFSGKGLRNGAVAVNKNPFRRVFGLQGPPQTLRIKPIPTHKAETFGDCVEMQVRATEELRPPTNVSAVKGKSQRVLHPEHRLLHCADKDRHRGVSLLDRPLDDDGQFDVLSASSMNQASQETNKHRPVLFGSVLDFRFV